MQHILELAKKNQQTAWQIIKETQIFEIWQSIGAEVNLVGSLKSGLLTKNLDIDFHVYSDPITISESFHAMEKLAGNPAIKQIKYKNLIDTEEECIEWNAWYEDHESNLWELDIIHIQKGSAFDGYVEKVTDSIARALTPETKEAILRIKHDIPYTNEKISGIEIYRAVLEGGVTNYPDFVRWRANHLLTGVLQWMP